MFTNHTLNIYGKTGFGITKTHNGWYIIKPNQTKPSIYIYIYIVSSPNISISNNSLLSD